MLSLTSVPISICLIKLRRVESIFMSRVEGSMSRVEGRGYHVSSGGQESKCQVDVSQSK